MIDLTTPIRTTNVTPMETTTHTTYIIKETRNNGTVSFVKQVSVGYLGVSGTQRKVFRGHSTVADINDARTYTTIEEATKKMRILQKCVTGSQFELVTK